MAECWYLACSVLKRSEGGPDAGIIEALAKEAGIPVRLGESPYVGHRGVLTTTQDKRKLRRLERICFG